MAVSWANWNQKFFESDIRWHGKSQRRKRKGRSLPWGELDRKKIWSCLIDEIWSPPGLLEGESPSSAFEQVWDYGAPPRRSRHSGWWRTQAFQLPEKLFRPLKKSRVLSLGRCLLDGQKGWPTIREWPAVLKICSYWYWRSCQQGFNDDDIITSLRGDGGRCLHFYDRQRSGSQCWRTSRFQGTWHHMHLLWLGCLRRFCLSDMPLLNCLLNSLKIEPHIYKRKTE